MKTQNLTLKKMALNVLKYKQLVALIVFALLSAKKGNKEHGATPDSEEGG